MFYYYPELSSIPSPLSYVQPAELPSAGQEFPSGSTSVASGWGQLAFNDENSPDVLYAVELPVVLEEGALIPDPFVGHNQQALLRRWFHFLLQIVKSRTALRSATR